jgi:hypothetical protein
MAVNGLQPHGFSTSTGADVMSDTTISITDASIACNAVLCLGESIYDKPPDRVEILQIGVPKR